MQRLLGDERLAEALFLFTVSLLLLGLLLAQYLAWAWLQPVILAAPDGPVALAFWLAQLTVPALCVPACLVGFKPAVTVTVTPSGLHLRQGPRALALDYDAVVSAKPISALLFHRHYGRHAATHVFASRFTREMLLLQTTRGPVVLGLLPEDHAALLQYLEAERAPAFDVPAARVA